MSSERVIELEAKLEAAEQESYRKVCQIAAIEMAALDPTQVENMAPEHPYYSAALRTVLELRKKYDELKWIYDGLCK